jgi:LTXXQ motif family protein
MQPQATTRQQQRAERKLQQQENRSLRSVPQQQRAAKREEINRARADRAQQRQQANQPSASRNANVQPNTLTPNARTTRRNGTARVTTQAAQQGRFAAAFQAQQGRNGNNARVAHVNARQAWSRGERAGFVPWYGPVFWPYAYSDIFDYAFWPDGYDDGYFAYAYDDFFDGVFWGESGPPAAYASTEPSAVAAPKASYAAAQELCKQPGSGVTAWPIAQISEKVGLNDDQKTLLNELKSAGQKAAGEFQVSCPAENAFPLTPPGRLQAMTTRIDSTLEAVQTVKPALDKFYNSLSDEQKARFNELGPKQTQTTGQGSAEQTQASADNAQAAKSCGDTKPGLTNLPIEKIEDVVKPTDAQENDLNNLQDATTKAVSLLAAACPDDTPLTPVGRLDAMEKRLQAMTDAAKAVKPALDSFYGSLSAEQKARFNAIGPELAKSNG